MNTVPGEGIFERFTMTLECKRPPPGWSCSRPIGHDGPCAATRDEDENTSSLVKLVNQLRKQMQEMLFNHANECEVLTNQIEELKATIEEIKTDRLSALAFIVDNGMVDQLIEWRKTKQG